MCAFNDASQLRLYDFTQLLAKLESVGITEDLGAVQSRTATSNGLYRPDSTLSMLSSIGKPSGRL